MVWATDVGNVLARPFDASGAAQGVEFHVNPAPDGYQSQASVAVDADGNFVVVWFRSGDLIGRRFSASGAAIGPEVVINSYTPDSQESPAVRSEPDGDFVVVWHSLDLVARRGPAGRQLQRRLRSALRILRRASRHRVPGQHLHIRVSGFPGAGDHCRRRLSRRLEQQRAGRVLEWNLRSTLRQLRGAIGRGISSQHRRHRPPALPERRRRRGRALRGGLADRRPRRRRRPAPLREHRSFSEPRCASER